LFTPVPRIPKAASQLRKELEAIGLSVEDLSRMFQVSVRSAKAWTTGSRRVPQWLMPALRIFRLLPPAIRRTLQESWVYDGLPAGAGRAAENRPRASVARHPFARIEEL
jgi:hypothetical protein